MLLLVCHLPELQFKISKQQYGFIDKRSTTLQLLKIIDDWTLKVEQGYKINAVYMDFMKAFD